MKKLKKKRGCSCCKKCPSCNGKKTITCMYFNGDTCWQEKCTTCNGTGRVDK